MFVNLSARCTVGLCLQTIYSFWKTGINHTGSKFHTCSVHITLKKTRSVLKKITITCIMKQKMVYQHTVRLKHHTSKMTVIVFHLKEKKHLRKLREKGVLLTKDRNTMSKITSGSGIMKPS